MHPAAALTFIGCGAWIAGIAIHDMFGDGVLSFAVAIAAGLFIGFLWEALRK